MTSESLFHQEYTVEDIIDILSLVVSETDLKYYIDSVLDNLNQFDMMYILLWASLEHCHASDNDVVRVPMPEFLKIPKVQ